MGMLQEPRSQSMVNMVDWPTMADHVGRKCREASVVENIQLYHRKKTGTSRGCVDRAKYHWNVLMNEKSSIK